MNARTLTVGAGLAILLANFATPAAATRNDCNAPSPGATEATPDGSTTDTLTDKLATCGSVLVPPPLGDSGIIEPTPPVNDDINLHPHAPAVRP